MKLVGARGQAGGDPVYASTITIGSGGGSFLVLPNQSSRCFLEISTPTAAAIGFVAMGAGEATATISGGQVTSIAVVDGGFNYTLPPAIIIQGGGNGGNTTFIGAQGDPLAQPPGAPIGGTQPQAWNRSGSPAVALAALSGGAISSIAVTNPGAGYITPPYVWIVNNSNDPNGCANPFRGGAGTGRQVTSGSPLLYNDTSCPTSPIGIYCATSGAVFLVKWMP